MLCDPRMIEYVEPDIQRQAGLKDETPRLTATVRDRVEMSGVPVV